MGRTIQRMRVYVIAVLAVLTAVVATQSSASAASKADMAGVKAAVIKAYKSYQKKIDVSSYHLYNERDGDAINEMMTEVMAKTPDLFYVGQQYAKLVNPTTRQVKGLELYYGDSFMTADNRVNTAKIKKVRGQINKKVKKIVSLVSPKMTSLEKAMFFHDYIIQNTAYCDNEADYCTSEWGIFVKGKGNCQGYSKAYGILLDRVGISVRYVDSASMHHMWNMVRLGGKWYHVDVTWDDPLDPQVQKDQYGLVMHDMFLCSTSQMKKQGYKGFKTGVKTSTKYDKKYWKQVNSAFVYRNGKWLFQTGSAIKQRNRLASGSAKTLYKAGGRSFIQVSKNRYYFINYNRVYVYNRKTNQIRLVLDGTQRYRQYNITQLQYQKGKLVIRMINGAKLKTIKKTV